MVALSTVHTSNANISAALSAAATTTTTTKTDTPIVAVFVGATSGIGKSSLLQFAKHTAQLKPRIYFVGRSQAAADEILQQLHHINTDGEQVFIKADVSLLRQVDDVCKQIKDKENTLNVLFLSQGTLDMTAETSEELTMMSALSYYSRMRFVANLLPLLQAAGAAPSLSRVISVLAGTKEGPINPTDIPGKRVALWRFRGHLCSMMTLTMEHFAEMAQSSSSSSSSSVSFVHSDPGSVDTGLGRSMTAVVGGAMKVLFPLGAADAEQYPAR